MFAVTITYSVRLGQLTAFLAEVERLISAMTRQEEGPAEARALSDPSRPGKAMLVLYFDSAAAFEAYRTAPDVRGFDSRVVDMVTGRALSTWSNVSGTHTRNDR